MGIQFVQMASEHRAGLNRLLSQLTTQSTPEKKKDSSANPSAPRTPTQEIHDAFKEEITHLLSVAKKGNFYQLFEVSADSSVVQIKQKFYMLAHKFHPDHHM